MAKLVCSAGMNKGDEFTLTEGINSLGRGQECKIVLFDKKCSRIHCQIIKKGTYYALEDQNSRNGTFLNGKPILKKSTPVKDGDHIRLGRTILVLSEKGAGGIMEQVATEASEELQKKGFAKLVDNAAADVLKTKHGHASTGKSGFFHTLRKWLGKE